MAKKKLQRRWIVGNSYEVIGVRHRWMKLLARIKVSKGEALIFRPLRRARKTRKKKAKKGQRKR